MRVNIEVGPDLYQEINSNVAKRLIEAVLQQLEQADVDDPDSCQEALLEIECLYDTVLDHTLGDMIRLKMGKEMSRPQKVRRLAGLMSPYGGGFKQAHTLLSAHGDDLDSAIESLVD